MTLSDSTAINNWAATLFAHVIIVGFIAGLLFRIGCDTGAAACNFFPWAFTILRRLYIKHFTHSKSEAGNT